MSGVGYLLGSDVRVRFCPAPADTGVVFVRTDLPGCPEVPARVEHVIPRERRTVLQRGEAVVEMVEHVLASLSGLRIDNCRVEIDAPETPGCDGSSLQFTEALAEAGMIEQDRPRESLFIRSPVTVKDGKSTLTAHPGVGDRLVLTYNLDYGSHTPIGRQSHFVELCPDSFSQEVASSRTFLLAQEADMLRKTGIGSRTATTDLLIFGEDGPIDNELRFPNECARHKILDMVGDLALLGKDLVGHVVAHRSGHALNAELVRELLKLGKDDWSNAEQSPSDPEAPPPVMDVEAVMKILPHRYPFLLIDRVLSMEPNKNLLALKNVTCNEPFFVGHWPTHPIMPGVLIIEALAQAAGILIGQVFHPSRNLAMLVSIDDTKLRRKVVPGDQLHLEIHSFRSRTKIVEASGIARVGDQVAAEARLRFAIMPIEASAA
jgi:UDP-3-O-[3-hydroxymyristoyl] N-acetylglucosamine deacetylase/3-hydroxyacyl-[acyl-carrier-protein] dehydratase